MEDFLKKFLEGVAWPAAAGNVAWSFATLIIDKGIGISTLPRLGVLGLLSIYLAAEWYRNTKVEKPNVWGLAADLAFVLLIVWFAIGMQLDAGHADAALILMLVLIGVGHLCRIWPPAGPGTGNVPHGLVCLAFAGVLGGAKWLSEDGYVWLQLFALAVILGVWAKLRRGKTV